MLAEANLEFDLSGFSDNRNHIAIIDENLSRKLFEELMHKFGKSLLFVYVNDFTLEFLFPNGYDICFRGEKKSDPLPDWVKGIVYKGISDERIIDFAYRNANGSCPPIMTLDLKGFTQYPNSLSLKPEYPHEEKFKKCSQFLTNYITFNLF